MSEKPLPIRLAQTLGLTTQGSKLSPTLPIRQVTESKNIITEIRSNRWPIALLFGRCPPTHS